MKKIVPFPLVATILLVLAGCTLPTSAVPISADVPAVKLIVQTQNGSSTLSQAGETIAYKYVLTNTGTVPLAGPVLVVDGSKPVTCPNVNTVGNLDNYLDVNETVTCSASYTITPEDVAAGRVTNLATAAIGGVTSNQTGITLRRMIPVSGPGETPTPFPTTTPIPEVLIIPANLSAGSTIQHRVTEGEWLAQIARCYGASEGSVEAANPQITDPLVDLPPSTTVTVPSIGSVGKIYGPPCVLFYTVQSGDTWYSIAQRYNADVRLLQDANPGVERTSVVPVGMLLRVPLNSTSTYPTYNPPAYYPSYNIQTIEFAPGSNSVRLAGMVTASGRSSYALKATEGQILSIQLTGAANAIAFVAFDSNLNVLKPMDASLTWTGLIPATGDYYIDILNVLGTSDQSYTLDVSFPTAGNTSTIPATGSGQPTQDAFAVEEIALSQLPKGNFAYTLPPSVMVKDQSFIMVLQLSPSFSATELVTRVAAASGLPTSPAQPGTLMAPNGGSVALHSDVVEITPFMQATLLAEDRDAFEIVPLHDQAIQAVDPYSTTNWEWNIIAKKPGPQRLLLIISRQVRKDDEGHWHMIQTYKADINVNVTLSQRLAALDWKWIAGILIPALLIPGFWRWYDQRKKATEPMPKAKQPRMKSKT